MASQLKQCGVVGRGVRQQGRKRGRKGVRAPLAVASGVAMALVANAQRASAAVLIWDPLNYGPSGSGYDNTGPASDGPGYWDATNAANTVWLDPVGGSDVTWTNTGGYTAVFGVDPGYSSGFTVTMNSSIVAAGIIFSNNPSYTIAGNGFALNLGSGGVTVSSGVSQVETITGAVNFNNAGPQIVNNGITGSGLTFSGAVVTGANAMVVNGSGNTSFTGTLNTSGGVVLNGTGTTHFSLSGSPVSGGLTINSGTTGSFDRGLFGGNPFATGQTILVNSGGTLFINAAHALGGSNTTTPANTIVVNGGTVVSNDEQYFSTITLIGGTANKGTTGDGSYEFRATGVGSTINSNASSTASVFNTNLVATYGSITLNVAAGTVPGGAADLAIAGAIAGSSTSYAITKTGAGTLALAGVDTYVGPTNITSGTVIVGTSGSSVGAITATSAINLGLGATNGVLQIGDASNPASVTTSALNILGTGTGNLIVGGNAGFSNFTLSSAVASSFGFALGGPGTYQNNLGLTKTGVGALTLTASNTYLGPTSVLGGSLTLAQGATIPATSTLNVGGGSLILAGSQNQTFGATNILAGSSVITSSGGTLALNAITRSAGGYVDFGAGTGTLTTTSQNVNGILGAYATYGGQTTYATVGAGGVITGLTAYTETSVAGTTAANYAGANVDVNSSAGAISGATTPNTFRFNTAAATAVTFAAGSTNVLASGGILETAAVGANASNISGGTLTLPAAGVLLVQQYDASGALTIGSVIADSAGGTVSLQKFGPGNLSLTSPNTFTGGVTLSGNGSLSISDPAALGTGLFTFNSTNSTAGFIANTTAALAVANNIAIPTTAGTYIVQKNSAGQTTGTPLTFNGTLSGGGSGVTLELNSGTSGDYSTTYVLNGTNTFAAGTVIDINRGSLVVGSTGALGAATVKLDSNANAAAGNLQFNVGGTFPNAIATTGAYPISTNANNVTLTGIISGAGQLVKLGTGMLTLTPNNTFTGNTTVNAGTLQIQGAGGAGGALASPQIIVNAGGLLQLNGSGSDVIGYTANREALVINSGGTVNNIGMRQTIESTITMTGGTLGGTAPYELDDSSGVNAFNASSDSAGVAANIASGASVALTRTLVFNVTRGTAAPASDFTINAPLNVYSGTPGITKTGNGILTLTANNGLTGPANVSAGTLVVTGGTSLVTPTILIGSGATLQLNTTDTLGYTSGKAAVTINGGTLQTFGSVHQTIANTITMTGGTIAATGTIYPYALQWYNGAGLTATSDAAGNPATISARTALQPNSTNNVLFTINRGAASPAIDVIDSGGIVNQNGGTDALTKAGNGIFQMTGSSSYNGGTNISAGVLRADGAVSSLGTGTTNVLGGVLAGGSKTVTAATGGPVIVSTGGTITAGTGITAADSVGNLSSGAQTWNSGGTYVSKFDTTGANDKLLMSGLTVSATNSSQFTVNLVTTTGASVANGTYVLAVDSGVTYTAGADPFTTAALSLQVNGATANPVNYSLTESADTTGVGGTDLVLTAAPEPTSLLLLASLITPGLLGRRRTARRSA